jgi:hypothetical protein
MVAMGTAAARREQRALRRCIGVDDDDGAGADFSDAELADNAGNAAAAAITRDLARSAAIPVGGGGMRKMAGCCDASRCAATASCPLGAPPPLVH